MTSTPFTKAFPGFLDPDARHPYDADPEPAVVQLLTGLGAGDHDLAALVTEMDTALRQLITLAMPPEGVTENSDFSVEDRFGSRVGMVEQMARFADGAGDSPVSLRLTNPMLEGAFQALLDHLTAKRIVEELDAPTYVERLRGGFRRVRDGAVKHGAVVSAHLARIETIKLRVVALRRLADTLRSDVMPSAAGNGQAAVALDRDLSGLARIADQAERFLAHLKTFMEQSELSLSSLAEEFSGHANVAGAEGEAVRVSREAERHAIFRPLPLLWALVIAVMVKITLGQSGSVVLHQLAFPILLLSFALTWVLSIYIGIWARSKRMDALRAHIHTQLSAVLQSDTPKEELVEFPPVGADAHPVRPDKLVPFSYRGHDAQQKARVTRRNLLALLIPAMLALVVAATRQPEGQNFIARFDGRAPCMLAEGHLVAATRNAYLVRPDGAAQTGLQMAVGTVLPELFADVIDRSHIVAIEQAGADPLPRCSVTDPSLPVDPQDAVTVNLGPASLSGLAQAFAHLSPGQDSVDLNLPDSVIAYFEGAGAGEQISTGLDQNFAKLIAAQSSLESSLTAALEGLETNPMIISPALTSTVGSVGPVSAHLFQTSFELPQTETLTTLANTLVLPFFTAPVEKAGQTIDNPRAAFEWGADPDNLTDPIVTADNRTYFSRIADTLRTCLAEGAMVEVDVLGLASRSWDGPVGASSPGQLNYYLAEGRRIGALRMLQRYLGREVMARIAVQLADGSYMPMPALLERARSGEIRTALKNIGRFDGRSTFETRRDVLLAVTALNSEVASPLEELFGRSVVLRIVRAEGGPCQF